MTLPAVAEMKISDEMPSVIFPTAHLPRQEKRTRKEAGLTVSNDLDNAIVQTINVLSVLCDLKEERKSPRPLHSLRNPRIRKRNKVTKLKQSDF